jgi:xanthine dehydrogenase accessory factor
MEVFIEPLEPSPRLMIVGAGHVSQRLAAVAGDAGFLVHVLDDREKFANRDRFPHAAEVIVADIAPYLATAEIPRNSYVVVITRGHTHDLEAMRALAGRECRYVGMIGSRAKVARITDALAGEGVPADWLQRIFAPVGLRIGAVTPEEIAISIAAELIAVRRGVLTHPQPALPTMREGA